MSSSSAIKTEGDVKSKTMHLEPPKSDYLGRSVRPLTKADKCASAAKWIGVAVIATALLVGLIGLLVYIGKLNLGLEGIGNMSQATGLYTMLGGFGIAFITAVLLSVSACVQKARAHAAAKNATLLVVE